MKNLLKSALAAMGLLFATLTAASAACTPTGFIRDGIDMTAALINPGNVVNQQVDATGCNIGIYYGHGSTGLVRMSDIHGANYFGIVTNGSAASIQNSKVHDIGETPFNGSQHGVGIYCAPESAQANPGVITGNMLWNYQKGGIVVNGPNCGSKRIAYNTLVGFGPVGFIAQNGIQVRSASNVAVLENSVSGHSYTGAGQASSGGILNIGGDCFGGASVSNNRIANNNLTSNDVGVFDLNLDSSCVNAHPAVTKNVIADNSLWSQFVTNTTGGGSAPYQFALSVAASGDRFTFNSICGKGYGVPTASAQAGPIDTAGSATNLTIKSNDCVAPGVVTKLKANESAQLSATRFSSVARSVKKKPDPVE